MTSQKDSQEYGYQRLFKAATSSPHHDIAALVMARIEHSRLRRARLMAGATGTLVLGSAGALVPTAQYAWLTAEHSGFFSYLSLVLSDGGALARSWQELAWSMVDATPLLGGIMTVGLILLLGLCVRSFARSLSTLSAHRELQTV